MVVCHDYADTGVPGFADSLGSSDPVVAGQDHTDPVLRGIDRHLRIHTVSVQDPVGKDDIRLCAAHFQRMHEYVGGTDSVHIIVADHAYRRAPAYFTAEDSNCLVHVRKQTRIMKIRQIPPQKALCLLNTDHIAIADQTSQHLRDPAGLRYCAEIFFFLINHPFCHVFPPCAPSS